MNESKTANAEQLEYWNGEAGERWAQQDEMMAGLLRPIAESLLEHASVEGCRSAIDIGCGGGSQSLLLAQRLGAGARVLGVDISGPLLKVAKERAAAAPANWSESCPTPWRSCVRKRAASRRGSRPSSLCWAKAIPRNHPSPTETPKWHTTAAN